MKKRNLQFTALTLAVALICVASFMWTNIIASRRESPPNYFEVFSDAGFTLVRTDSKLSVATWTDDMDRFVDGMLGYSVPLRGGGGTIAVGPSRLKDSIIYWRKDSGALVFYYIDFQGRCVAFRVGGQ